LLKEQPPEIAFDSLLWILEHNSSYQQQVLSGELLGMSNLPSHRSLDDILR
jgi:hypothetical protein